MINKKELVLNSCAVKGTNLIEASAGTGKTYTIAGLFLRMVVENELVVSEILVVTFTRAATEELKDRIYSLLITARNCFNNKPTEDEFLLSLKANMGDKVPDCLKRIKNAIRDFDECAVYTIHGFCQRMLVENAFESHSLYDSEVITDQSDYILDAVQDFWRSRLYYAPMFLIDEFVKVGIDGLIQLFGYRERNPELRIIGSKNSPSLDDVMKSLATYNDSYHFIRDLLPKSSSALFDLFELDKKFLSGTTFSPKYLPNYCNHIFSYFINNQPLELLDVPDKIHLFSTDFMQTKLLKSNKDQLVPSSPIFVSMDKFLKDMSTFQELKNDYILNLKIEMFDEVEERLQKRKTIDNVQSFNDFLIHLKTSLLGESTNSLAEDVRKKYKAAMIDEFQDTDPVQYAIFNSLFSKDRILFLIGDPKQAIYSFRGADVYAYMKASEDVETVYTLPKNYRSDEQLVKAVNSIFSLSANPFAENSIQFESVTAHQSGVSNLVIEGDDATGIVLWTTEIDGDKDELKSDSAENAVCLGITSEIYKLLSLSNIGKAYIVKDNEKRPLKPSDFAVLVRKKSEMIPLERLLTKYGIPCVLSGSSSIYDSDEAVDLRRFLYAVQHHGDSGGVKAAMAGEYFGATANDIDAMNSGENDDLEIFISHLKEYIEIYNTKGFINMFRVYMKHYSIKERLISLENGERKLTNMLHLSEILHEKASSSGAGLIELYKWFCLQIENPALRVDETELRMETDENAVTIVTIHKSKGLEYPIVFAPYVWGKSDISDYIYHEDDHMVLQLGDDIDEAVTEKAFIESLSENMRLYYVALTRARHRCYTFWGAFGPRSNADSSAPAYLFHNGKSEITEDFRKVLKDNMKGMKNSDVSAHLESLFSNNPYVQVIPMANYIDGDKLNIDVTTSKYTALQANVRIVNGSRVTSFSGITRKITSYDHSAKDVDKLVTDIDEVEDAIKYSIFDFQRGAKVGTFLHEYFEYLDFPSATDERSGNLLDGLMKKYGFDTEYKTAIWDMKNNVLGCELEPDLKLSDLGNNKRLNEMEFHFSIENLRVSDFKKAFQESNINELFKEKMVGLNFNTVQGFMTGFIDLTFEYNGKYYILDWKSNHLGNSYESYGKDPLINAMAEHYYFLQYTIYTVALHRYLKQNLKDYNYDTHFGGAYYIFLRGVSDNSRSGTGVFFDKPKFELIDNLDKVFG